MGFAVHALRRPQGYGLSCDVKCEPEQGVTGLSRGMTVPTGRESFTSKSPSHSVKHSEAPSVQHSSLCHRGKQNISEKKEQYQ